jgi:hypothetical protein
LCFSYRAAAAAPTGTSRSSDFGESLALAWSAAFFASTAGDLAVVLRRIGPGLVFAAKRFDAFLTVVFFVGDVSGGPKSLLLLPRSCPAVQKDPNAKIKAVKHVQRTHFITLILRDKPKTKLLITLAGLDILSERRCDAKFTVRFTQCAAAPDHKSWLLLFLHHPLDAGIEARL